MSRARAAANSATAVVATAIQLAVWLIALIVAAIVISYVVGAGDGRLQELQLGHLFRDGWSGSAH